MPNRQMITLFILTVAVLTLPKSLSQLTGQLLRQPESIMLLNPNSEQVVKEGVHIINFLGHESRGKTK